MHRMSARDAKNGFGRLIDLARAEPVAIEKYGRSVVVVLAVYFAKRKRSDPTPVASPTPWVRVDAPNPGNAPPLSRAAHRRMLIGGGHT